MQMYMVPTNMTYYTFLVNYRNTVNQKFPNTAVNIKSTRRRFQQTNTGSGRRVRNGRGNNRRGGRGGLSKIGGCGRGGRGGGQRDDEWKVIGIDGTSIKVHPEY